MLHGFTPKMAQWPSHAGKYTSTMEHSGIVIWYIYTIYIYLSLSLSLWLVVWNMNFIFPYIGNNNPNWLISQRGWSHQPVYIYIYTLQFVFRPLYCLDRGVSLNFWNKERSCRRCYLVCIFTGICWHLLQHITDIQCKNTIHRAFDHRTSENLICCPRAIVCFQTWLRDKLQEAMCIGFLWSVKFLWCPFNLRVSNQTSSGWWFGTWVLFSISYMGCHPSHWRTPSFFKMVFKPPTSHETHGSTGVRSPGNSDLLFPLGNAIWGIYWEYTGIFLAPANSKEKHIL